MDAMSCSISLELSKGVTWSFFHKDVCQCLHVFKTSPFATMWYLLFQLITCRLISTVDSTHPHITTNQVFWRNIITSRLLSEWVVLILVKPEICSHRETWTRLCWYELSAWLLIEKPLDKKKAQVSRRLTQMTTQPYIIIHSWCIPLRFSFKGMCQFHGFNKVFVNVAKRNILKFGHS